MCCLGGKGNFFTRCSKQSVKGKSLYDIIEDRRKDPLGAMLLDYVNGRLKDIPVADRGA